MIVESWISWVGYHVAVILREAKDLLLGIT